MEVLAQGVSESHPSIQQIIDSFQKLAHTSNGRDRLAARITAGINTLLGDSHEQHTSLRVAAHNAGQVLAQLLGKPKSLSASDIDAAGTLVHGLNRLLSYRTDNTVGLLNADMNTVSDIFADRTRNLMFVVVEASDGTSRLLSLRDGTEIKIGGEQTLAVDENFFQAPDGELYTVLTNKSGRHFLNVGSGVVIYSFGANETAMEVAVGPNGRVIIVIGNSTGDGNFKFNGLFDSRLPGSLWTDSRTRGVSISPLGRAYGWQETKGEGHHPTFKLVDLDSRKPVLGADELKGGYPGAMFHGPNGTSFTTIEYYNDLMGKCTGWYSICDGKQVELSSDRPSGVDFPFSLGDGKVYAKCLIGHEDYNDGSLGIAQLTSDRPGLFRGDAEKPKIFNTLSRYRDNTNKFLSLDGKLSMWHATCAHEFYVLVDLASGAKPTVHVIDGRAIVRSEDEWPVLTAASGAEFRFLKLQKVANGNFGLDLAESDGKAVIYDDVTKRFLTFAGTRPVVDVKSAAITSQGKIGAWVQLKGRKVWQLATLEPGLNEAQISPKGFTEVGELTAVPNTCHFVSPIKMGNQSWKMFSSQTGEARGIANRHIEKMGKVSFSPNGKEGYVAVVVNKTGGGREKLIWDIPGYES